MELSDDALIFAAAQSPAIFRQLFQEGSKGFFDFVNVPIIIQMIDVDIQQDDPGGMKAQKTPLVFAGLGKKQVFTPVPDTPAHSRKYAADMNGGVQVRFDQNLRQHRGHGSLTVCTADTYRLTEFLRQLPQQPRSGPDGYSSLCRS